MTRSGGARDRGQSTVEFALILPVIFVLLLGVVQVGLVIQAQITVTHAAREVARQIAVDPSVDANAVIASATTLDPARVVATVSFDTATVPDRQTARVRVRYEVPSVSGFVESWLSPVHVEASVAMLVER